MNRKPFISVTYSFLLLISAGWTISAEADSRVLFLGDSFSMGSFGRVLDHRMRETGLQVTTIVAGGASPYYWLPNYQSLPCTIGFWEKTTSRERRLGYIRAVPKMDDLMTEVEPDIVVVQTGVNLYATLRSKRRPKGENVKEINFLIDQMCQQIAEHDAKAYWILPPHSHEDRYPIGLQKELAGIIKKIVKEYNGAVFESQKYTHFTEPYPATDGIHYGPDEAADWAERVAADFRIFMNINSSYAARIPIRAIPIQGALMSITPLKKKEKPQKEGIITQQGEALELTLELIEKSEIKNLNDVPYRNALGVFEYKVLRDHLGNYPHDKIRVAHGIVFNRRQTSSARIQIGAQRSLKLEPLSKYPNLQTWQTVDELRPNFEMPLYTPRLN